MEGPGGEEMRFGEPRERNWTGSLLAVPGGSLLLSYRALLSLAGETDARRKQEGRGYTEVRVYAPGCLPFSP